MPKARETGAENVHEASAKAEECHKEKLAEGSPTD